MKVKKYLTIFKMMILPLFLVSCAQTPVINSSLSKLRDREEGAILNVDLITNKNIKQERQCHLKIESSSQDDYILKLNKGENNYAMNLANGTYRIKKIHCGPFYYYDLTKHLHNFTINHNKISYLGGFKISLENKGLLDIVINATAKKELTEKLLEIGVNESEVLLNPFL